MAATVQYSPPIVILSLAIGIIGSLTALKLAFRSGGHSLATWGWDKIGSALILGSAIGGLHYTAMGAVTFIATPPLAPHFVKGLVLPSPGPVALSVATFLVLNLALCTSLIDRRFAEALRQSEGRLRSLYKTGQAVVSNLELEPLLQTITDTAKSLLHARMSGLVVFAEGSKGCESVTVSGGAYNLDPLLYHSEFLRFPANPGACRRVDNIATHITGLVSREPEDPPLKAFLFIPLHVKGGNLGILFVAKGSQDTQFTKDDEDLLLAFANDAALALEHGRLYDQQKRDVIRLKELSQELNEAQEKRLLTEERNRIAQEMHDQIAQVLFTIGLKATWCLERMSPNSEIVQPVHTIKRLASEGGLHIRNAIYNLSSPQTEPKESLRHELCRVVSEFKEATGIASDLVVAGELSVLPCQVEDALCKVTKEALTNVAKHSQAKVTVVSLRATCRDITLTVQDDGIGLPRTIMDTYQRSVHHFGLTGMQQRVESIGGQFRFRNGEEGGALITATVPLKGIEHEKNPAPHR